MLKARKLGFSYVRLLPKDTGVRPIVNLRRRAIQMGVGRFVLSVLKSANASLLQPRGAMELGRSINSLLENLFQVLNFEKVRYSPDIRRWRELTRRRQNRDSALLGASVLGPNEIYDKIKSFKLKLLGGGKTMYAFRALATRALGFRQFLFLRPKLYFVKVDVRACFDTIKQDKLLEIVDAILREVSPVPLVLPVEC